VPSFDALDYAHDRGLVPSTSSLRTCCSRLTACRCSRLSPWLGHHSKPVTRPALARGTPAVHGRRNWAAAVEAVRSGTMIPAAVDGLRGTSTRLGYSPGTLDRPRAQRSLASAHRARRHPGWLATAADPSLAIRSRAQLAADLQRTSRTLPLKGVTEPRAWRSVVKWRRRSPIRASRLLVSAAVHLAGVRVGLHTKPASSRCRGLRFMRERHTSRKALRRKPRRPPRREGPSRSTPLSPGRLPGVCRSSGRPPSEHRPRRNCTACATRSGRSTRRDGSHPPTRGKRKPVPEKCGPGCTRSPTGLRAPTVRGARAVAADLLDLASSPAHLHAGLAARALNPGAPLACAGDSGRSRKPCSGRVECSIGSVPPTPGRSAAHAVRMKRPASGGMPPQTAWEHLVVVRFFLFDGLPPSRRRRVRAVAWRSNPRSLGGTTTGAVCLSAPGERVPGASAHSPPASACPRRPPGSSTPRPCAPEAGRRNWARPDSTAALTTRPEVRRSVSRCEQSSTTGPGRAAEALADLRSALGAGLAPSDFHYTRHGATCEQDTGAAAVAALRDCLRCDPSHKESLAALPVSTPTVNRNTSQLRHFLQAVLADPK